MLKNSVVRTLSALMLVMVLVFPSCKDGGENDIPDINDIPEFEEERIAGDYYTASYRFKSGVIRLDDEAREYLVKVEHDSVLYFSSEMPSAWLPRVGSVVSSDVSEITPYGLGNVVESSSVENGLVKCVTTVAPLEDLFETLEVEGSIPLTEFVPEIITDDMGNVVPFELIDEEVSKAQSIAGPKLVFHPKINLGDEAGGSDNGGSMGLYFNGELWIRPTLYVDISLKNRRFDMELGSDLGLSASFGVQVEMHGYKRILGPAKIVSGHVVLGPLVLRPFIDMELGVAGSYENKLHFDFAYDASFAGGRRDGKWHMGKVSDSGVENLVRGVDVDGKGSVELQINTTLAAGLYTKNLAFGFEPTLSLGASVECTLDDGTILLKNPMLNVDADLRAKGALLLIWGKRELWKESIDLFDVNFLHFQWPLFPQFVANSLKVSRREGHGELIYDAEFKTDDNGLLSYFCELKPAVWVSKDGVGVLSKSGDRYVRGTSERTERFELNGLEEGTRYEIRRCVVKDGRLLLGESLRFPAPEIVGTWRYEDKEHNYYQINVFGEDGSYRYEERALYNDSHDGIVAGELLEWGEGSYVYNEDGNLLETHVTSGDDAPFKGKYHCVINGNIMVIRDLLDEKGRDETFVRQ